MGGKGVRGGDYRIARIGNYVAVGPVSDVEERDAGKRVGMIADVPRIIPLDHRHAGVVIDCNNPKWNAREQLTDYIRVPERIDGHLGRVQAGGSCGLRKRVLHDRISSIDQADARPILHRRPCRASTAI